MVIVSMAETLPVASVARAWTWVTPSADTWNGAVYAVQGPLPTRYSRASFPSPPAPVRVTVTGEVNQLLRPFAATGAVVTATVGLAVSTGSPGSETTTSSWPLSLLPATSVAR